MTFHTIRIHVIIFMILIPWHTHTVKPPKLTVIFVIDQFPYDYFNRLHRTLQHGLKKLFTRGIVFTNAHHQHGMPATCTGHTALSTGVYGMRHGIVGNAWYNYHNKKISCDAGTKEKHAVFSPTGLYDYGKSPEHIMVDGLSDQFVVSGTKTKPHYAYSVSLKSRAAIATASRAGKALWFDDQSGRITSSKAYFDTLPAWVQEFNQKHAIHTPKIIHWKQLYDDQDAYQSKHDTYQYTRIGKPIINTDIAITNKEDGYNLFMMTPHANKLILDLAESCVAHHMHKDNPNRLLLWVCVSSVDKLGHQFGPWSKEAIDMIYYLDKDIKNFMQELKKYVDSNETLFVLTSDHGIPPIIEFLHQKGLNMGHRIHSQTLIREINNFVEQRYGIQNLIHAVKNHHLYINQSKLDNLDPLQKEEITNRIKEVLKTQPGIKQVWTPDELYQKTFAPRAMEYFFKNQLYPGRSGTFIIQTHPYTIIKSHKKGTSHSTPHTYNTRVPIIIHWPGHTQKKTTQKRVLALQLANTLASLLQIPQPSSSHHDVLPYVFDN